LTAFLLDFDPFYLVAWLLGLLVGAPLAFALGRGYGKWFKFSNVPRSVRGNKRLDEHLAANDLIVKGGGVSDQASESPHEVRALCKEFIGQKEIQYYMAQFEHLAREEPNRKVTSEVFSEFRYATNFLVRTWNWSAFLFSYAWALYRKLYGWSAVLFVVSFVCLMAMIEGSRAFGFVSLIAAWVAFGAYANALYYSKAKKTIADAQQLADSEEEIIAKVRGTGGIEGWASLVAMGHALLGVPALLLMLAGSPQSSSPATTSDSALTLNSGEVVNEIAPAQEHPSSDSALGTTAPEVVDSDRHIRDLYDTRRFSELVQFARQRLAEYPTDTLAANYAGLAWMGMQNPIEARLWFEKAVDLNPESPSLYYNLASTYDVWIDYKKIIDILTAAQQINSENSLVNDALISAQRFAQQIEADRAARAPIRAIQPSPGQAIDDSDCQVKPVMSDEEIRRWRKCNQHR
jgi:tetratricopeptide (TPR) repeat protein